MCVYYRLHILKGLSMTLNEAIAKRIRAILKERKMTQYRLEMDSGIYHNTMSAVLNARYKTSHIKTIAIIIRTLGMTVSEFFDDPIFDLNELNID